MAGDSQVIILAKFVAKHRLRMKRNACGDLIVVGRLGHIAEHGSGFFSILLEDTASGSSRSRALLSRRRKALAAGFRLHQAGDCESVLLFDPTNAHQVKLAIRLVMARPKRLASAAQLANLRKPLGRKASHRVGTTQPTPPTTNARGRALATGERDLAEKENEPLDLKPLQEGADWYEAQFGPRPSGKSQEQGDDLPLFAAVRR